MMRLRVALFCWVVLATAASGTPGYFWHVTDFHWDYTYSRTAKALSCGPKATDKNYGKFGDYLCDAPWTLINSSVHAMKQLHPNPDFLIWTGDDTPHIWNDTILNKEVVKNIIFNLTDLLMDVWPNTTVLSALGNHDCSPKNQLPPHGNAFYDSIAEKWAPWFQNDKNALNTFKKGGYYTLEINNKLRVVVLNTNLNYKSNKLVANMTDPADQFQWLDQVLQNAKTASQKVIIVQHIPPGMFEKHRSYHWMIPSHNTQFINLVKKHANTIGSMHSAHHHLDSFRLFYDKAKPVASMFLAPAVTPWETTLPGVIGGAANNPGIRLVKYERETGEVLDIIQYYLDLKAANAKSQATWLEEYQGTKKYNEIDMGTKSLDNIAKKLLKDEDTFNMFYTLNGVSVDLKEKCVKECRAIQYCAVVRLDYEEFESCVKKTINIFNTADKAVSSIFFVLGSVVLNVLLCKI